MSPALVAPPQPDETFTLADFADDGVIWSASRRGTVDSDGVRWIVTSESGWHDGPPVRLDQTNQARADGAQLSQQWRAARTVVLGGSAHLPPGYPEATIDGVRRRWLGLCASGPRVGHLSAVAADGVGQALPQVVVSAAPKASVIVGTGWERRFSWQITMTSADPLKYSTDDKPVTCGLPQPSGGLVYPLTYPLDYHTSTETGQVTIVNTGTAVSWPRLLITGPFDQPTVANPDTGDTVTIGLTDPNPDDYLLIDTNPLTRRVLLNGAASRRAAARVSGLWVPCAPNTSTRLRYRALTYSTSRLTVVAPSASW